MVSQLPESVIEKNFKKMKKKFTIFEYEPGIKMNFSGPVGREEAESCPSTSPKTT